MGDLSEGFRAQILASSNAHPEAAWIGFLKRGDFFQLCELLTSDLMADPGFSGDGALQCAVSAAMADLLAHSSWYARQTGALRLEAATATDSGAAALVALDVWLAQLETSVLVFPSLLEVPTD